MYKKVSIILIIFLFAFSSLALSRDKMENSLEYFGKTGPVSQYLRTDAGDDEPYGAMPGKPLLSPRIATTFAPSIQVYDVETTQRDRQHYTTMGRQIAYGGYFNPSCDYVYLDYSYSTTVGSSSLYWIRYGIYDWGASAWDFGASGIKNASKDAYSSNTCNLEVTPDNGWAVIAYHTAGSSTDNFYSQVAYTSGCAEYDMLDYTDTLYGPPNVDNIETGYCGDNDVSTTPYAWPNLDMGISSTGVVTTHVVSTKSGGCTLADNQIETSSMVYWRKEETTANNPWSGTWQGPYFIDSVYDITGVVVSEKNTDNVYICYLKPMYYQAGTSHPCSNGEEYLGYYQFTNEVCYRASSNNGVTWDPITYITDYANGYEDQETDPAWYDIDALVDPDGVLHIIWSSRNMDPTEECTFDWGGCKLWHWDADNGCISIAYDGTHPLYFMDNTRSWSYFGAWNIAINKFNISWCDDGLYIVFNRFGANPVGDTSFDYGAGEAGESYTYQNGELLLVASDVDGSMGMTWTDAINLTQTPSDSCLPGECYSEHWPSMAMYSHESLMITYIEDKDAGAYGSNDSLSNKTDNPVMFMTWPCFSMSAMEDNVCLSVSPVHTFYEEIGLAPNGNTSGCTTPATHLEEVILSNCGNVPLSYTTSSNAAWLTVTSGASDNINAGAGPRNSDVWGGAPGCASPATIVWQASSASLGVGNYTGSIAVDIDNEAVDDFDIAVNLVVACEYYLPEFATVTGGCWNIDLFSTPSAGNGSENDNIGNMTYYTCGEDSTLHPLYTEALIVGWKVGTDIYCYTDNSDDHMGGLLPTSLPYYQRLNARMRALSELNVTAVGNPAGGSGYWATEGYWCTPDSVVYGKTEYFIPGHQDTSVVIEKVTIWNESGASLSGFVAGEGIDWDVTRDSNRDEGAADAARKMLYQYGCGTDADIYAGLACYSGFDGNYGGAILCNEDWIYPDTGYNIVDIYTKLTSLDNLYEIFSDSLSDLNSVFRFKEATFAATDTIEICKVKAISLDGLTGLQELIDKGFAFIEKYELCEPPPDCVGRCGDANNDGVVNVSDAVKVINYVFIGGDPPLPVLACGDANDDGVVNVSDAVKIINYVFIGGTAPTDCHIEAPAGGLPCCAF